MIYNLKITEENWKKHRVGNEYKNILLQAFQESYPNVETRFHHVSQFVIHLFLRERGKFRWISGGDIECLLIDIYALVRIYGNKNVKIKFPWEFSIHVEDTAKELLTEIIEIHITQENIEGMDSTLPRWDMEKMIQRSNHEWKIHFFDEEKFKMYSNDHETVWVGDVKSMKVFLRQLYFKQAYRNDINQSHFPIRFPLLVEKE